MPCLVYAWVMYLQTHMHTQHTNTESTHTQSNNSCSIYSFRITFLAYLHTQKKKSLRIYGNRCTHIHTRGAFHLLDLNHIYYT